MKITLNGMMNVLKKICMMNCTDGNLTHTYWVPAKKKSIIDTIETRKIDLGIGTGNYPIN